MVSIECENKLIYSEVWQMKVPRTICRFVQVPCEPKEDVGVED